MPQINDLNAVKWKVTIKNTCILFPIIRYKNNHRQFLGIVQIDLAQPTNPMRKIHFGVSKEEQKKEELSTND